MVWTCKYGDSQVSFSLSKENTVTILYGLSNWPFVSVCILFGLTKAPTATGYGYAQWTISDSGRGRIKAYEQELR